MAGANHVKHGEGTAYFCGSGRGVTFLRNIKQTMAPYPLVHSMHLHRYWCHKIFVFSLCVKISVHMHVW